MAKIFKFPNQEIPPTPPEETGSLEPHEEKLATHVLAAFLFDLPRIETDPPELGESSKELLKKINEKLMQTDPNKQP